MCYLLIFSNLEYNMCTGNTSFKVYIVENTKKNLQCELITVGRVSMVAYFDFGGVAPCNN